jgi:CheY-like chemotaxis protein
MAVILVAVSNGAVRASISVAAHEEGHSVFSIGDAGELVEAVEQKKPDLLFLDPALARMDVVEPLKQLKTLGLLDRLRFVLVDDRCAEVRTWAAVARQMGDGVLDSFRKDDVHRTIEGLLGMGRMPHPQAPAPPSPPAPAAAPPNPGKTMALNKTMVVGATRGFRPGVVPPPLPPGPSAPPPAPDPAPAASAPPPAQKPAPDDRRSILIVEDAPSLRVLLGMKFESAGWRVRWADSAEQALTLVAKEGCDVILSDINLPGMGGDQLVMTIRKQYPGVALLLMTGLPPEKRPKVPAGIPIFAKPLDLDAVLGVLERGVKPAKKKV